MKKIMYFGLVLIIMLIGINSVSAKSCSSYKKADSCKSSSDQRCVWNKEYKFCSNTGLVYVTCGSSSVTLENICNDKAGNAAYDVPVIVPKLTSFVVNALKIVTPIVLIFVGMIQVIKALVASSEDEMKKAQSSLIKKIIIAVVVFFVIAITQFIIDKVADASEKSGVSDCMDCFLNNNCSMIYYRDNNDKCKKISE